MRKPITSPLQEAQVHSRTPRCILHVSDTPIDRWDRFPHYVRVHHKRRTSEHPCTSEVVIFTTFPYTMNSLVPLSHEQQAVYITCTQFSTYRRYRRSCDMHDSECLMKVNTRLGQVSEALTHLIRTCTIHARCCIPHLPI